MTDASRVIHSTCASCGAKNADFARFCSRCGLAIGVETLTMPASLPVSATASTKRPPDAASVGGMGSPVPQHTGISEHVADPLIGVVVAERYRILELIGRGGMGVVYRVEHARIGKLMALKLLTGELTRVEEQVNRFKREALMASQLSHPNTVQVFDFGTSDRLVYLAMEYLRGEDLGRMIRRAGPLSVERTAKVVVQICSSLAEAHDKGIVHRDLKPENIIIVKGHSGEDVVKVLDFGLAKLRESNELAEVTSRGALVGTPYYMSPEQIRGDAIGPQSDVYALGALMYACLTGTVVFDAATPMGVLTKHLTEDPISPSARCPELEIPPSVSRIVLAALVKDPRKRIPSVQALQEALVAELKREGQPSVDILLDSREMRRLADADGEAATRDEVERYEAKLRRRGRMTWTIAGVVSLAAAAALFRVYQRMNAPVPFTGSESEPNNAASEADAVPFAAEVRGKLGQRLDRERSDRDFYRVEVKETGGVRLESSALPNMATCTLLYPLGSESPLGRYCTGGAGRDLVISNLRLEKGLYLLAVMQDREAYGGEPPPVHENVSDEYRLLLGKAADSADVEVEPNDFPRDANRVVPGARLRGRLGWMRDVDVVCATDGMGAVEFVVEDAIQRPRQRASVLQVTALAGPDQDVPVRVHPHGVKVPPSARDVTRALRTASVPREPARPACLSLTLVPNPWAPTPHPLVAPAGNEEYVVQVLAN